LAENNESERNSVRMHGLVAEKRTGRDLAERGWCRDMSRLRYTPARFENVYV